MEFNPELTKLDISENDIGPCALTIFKYAKVQGLGFRTLCKRGTKMGLGSLDVSNG